MSALINKILLTDRTSIERLLKSGKGIYTFLNPVSYLDALKRKELFMSFNGIFADGGLLAKAIKLGYGETVKRRSFDMTSLAPIVFSYAAKTGKSVAIVATKQGKRLGITVFQPRLKVCTFARTNSYEYGKQRQVQESP